MQSPKTTAIISGIAAILLGFRIFGASEATSSTLATMQWVFFVLAIVGLVGSLYRMSQGEAGQPALRFTPIRST